MSSRHNARKAAVQALYQWDLTGQPADQIETQFRQIHDMQNIDKKFLREVLVQVPNRAGEIQTAVSLHLDRDFFKLDPVERAILRLGAYELSHRPDVPTRVVMNEMIELAKIFGSDHSYKFINGVMDKMAKALRKPEPSSRKAHSKPSLKTAPKAAPKVESKAVPKVTSKAAPKVTSKTTLRVASKAEPKVAEPRVAAKAEPKAAPKAASKAAAKAAPKAAVKVAPKTAAKATPKAVAKATPKAAAKVPAAKKAKAKPSKD